MNGEHEPAKRDAKLVDGYCRRCDRTVMVMTTVYDIDHPEYYDIGSEFSCPRCGRREGRWTGSVLTEGATEPRFGIERESAIEYNQLGLDIAD